MDVLTIALLGFVTGAIFRSIYDFLWKAVENPDITFDTKYWATMLISIILSFISAMVTFTMVEIPGDGKPFVFLVTVSQGFMMNHLINKPVDYLSKKAG